MKIPLAEIKRPRGKLRNPSAVTTYAPGEQAPPITLWKLKAGLFKYYVEDGHHRYLAANSIGAKFIEAKGMPGFIEFYQSRDGRLSMRVVDA